MTPELEILAIITSIHQMLCGKELLDGAMEIEIYNKMTNENKRYFVESIEKLMEKGKITRRKTCNSYMYYVCD